MKRKRYLLILLTLLVLGAGGWWLSKRYNINPSYTVGQPLDSLDGVVVYYNGGVSHVGDRNTTADGYNLGLRYQCVEFVKRYYYQHLGHKMPDSYGNAKDFFDPAVADGQLNAKRDLLQYTHPSSASPRVGDLIIFDGTWTNPYGHVAIVSRVAEDQVEIIQQNPGPFGKSRVTFALTEKSGKWEIDNPATLGWLRKTPKE